MKRSSIWKLVGLAGLAGVAATGVAVARSERQRRTYTPEEVRARLHARLADIDGRDLSDEPGATGRVDKRRAGAPGRLGLLRGRFRG